MENLLHEWDRLHANIEDTDDWLDRTAAVERSLIRNYVQRIADREWIEDFISSSDFEPKELAKMVDSLRTL